MSWSRGLALARFASALISSTALRLERDSVFSAGVDCPWGYIQAHGTTTGDEFAAQDVCAPEISDWQAEYDIFKNRSRAARTVKPSRQEIQEQTEMREAVRELKHKPHQPHIVFIGDSMMRQQYYNLASWLINDEARPEAPDAKPDKEGNYQDFWTALYVHQKAQLQHDGASEVCHCGREDQKKNKDAVFVEDRFFTLPGNRASLSYFGWFGDWSFHGYCNSSDDRPTQASCPVGKCTSPFRWTVEQPGWQDAAGVVKLLDSVIVKLHPKPTHVVVNSGKWGHLTRHGLHKLFSAGHKIQKRDGIRFMWKTVSHSKSDKDDFHSRFVAMEVEMAQKFGWEVFETYNTTVEHVGREQSFLDELHFSQSVVTHLNRLYLEQLLQSL